MISTRFCPRPSLPIRSGWAAEPYSSCWPWITGSGQLISGSPCSSVQSADLLRVGELLLGNTDAMQGFVFGEHLRRHRYQRRAVVAGRGSTVHRHAAAVAEQYETSQPQLLPQQRGKAARFADGTILQLQQFIGGHYAEKFTLADPRFARRLFVAVTGCTPRDFRRRNGVDTEAG